MAALPEYVYDAAQVREIERIAVAQHGVSEIALMQRAGAVAWNVLQRHWPDAKHIAVLAGGGNNAGDGYVVAELARAAGCQVTVCSVTDPARLKHAAADARERYLQKGGVEQAFNDGLPDNPDVIVDALLGTGLDRPLTGTMSEAVTYMNGALRPVLALDIPSGLHADSGAAMGAAVNASVTVTFIAVKPGLLTGAGPRCCGELLFDDLGVPSDWTGPVSPRARRLGAADFSLHRRPRDAHKGLSGHVLIVGGDHGMGGAVRLAAEAALRAGAGLVSVATRAEHVPALIAGLPEAMPRAVEHADDLDALLARAAVVAIGPGLGQGAWSRALYGRAVEAGLPLVVDADALNLLAATPKRRPDWVLTPHPGEAARLLGSDTATVQSDRFQALDALLESYHGTVVLKGAGTLVGAHDELPAICDRGNPGMAAPGMGDALTGLIAALAAQGLPLPDAARAGVWVHAVAGDRAALRGERGMLARDLIAELRGLVNTP